MRKYIFVLAIFFVFFSAAGVGAFTGKGCGGECRDCHTLTEKEAGRLLKVKEFDASILKIEQSPVKGLWAIELSQNGKLVKVYMDYGKKHLIGNVVKISDLGRKPELKKVDLKKIPLGDALLMGSPDARYKVIVFDDPDCPYCAKLHVELKKILKKRKDIAFYIKLFPLPMHPDAYEKSKTILCGKSRAVSLLEDVFAGKKIGKPKCKSGTTIDDNIKLAAELGITDLHSGYAEADVLIGMIEKAGKK